MLHLQKMVKKNAPSMYLWTSGTLLAKKLKMCTTSLLVVQTARFFLRPLLRTCWVIVTFVFKLVGQMHFWGGGRSSASTNHQTKKKRLIILWSSQLAYWCICASKASFFENFFCKVTRLQKIFGNDC